MSWRDQLVEAGACALHESGFEYPGAGEDDALSYFRHLSASVVDALRIEEEPASCDPETGDFLFRLRAIKPDS